MAGKVSARVIEKHRDIRKQMSKGKANFTSINYYMIDNRKKNFSAKFKKTKR